ncbi:MAG: hypothetical protein R2731_13935 [Nocardioides sp.]
MEARSRLLAEITGYAGAGVIVGAAALLLAPAWSAAAGPARVGLLVGAAVGLTLAGLVVVVLGGGLSSLGAPRRGGRRRLVSVLLTSAAGSWAGAVLATGPGLAFDGGPAPPGALAAATVLAVGAGAGYLLAPSTLGQLTALGGWATASALVCQVALAGPSSLRTGLGLVAAGAGWLAMAEAGGWRERGVARTAGALLCLVGAQLPVPARSQTGYALTALLCVLGLALYLRTRALEYLLVAALAGTLAVPQTALGSLTRGGAAAAATLLVTGAGLVVAGLVGLRRRRRGAHPHRW